MEPMRPNYSRVLGAKISVSAGATEGLFHASSGALALNPDVAITSYHLKGFATVSSGDANRTEWSLLL